MKKTLDKSARAKRRKAAKKSRVAESGGPTKQGAPSQENTGAVEEGKREEKLTPRPVPVVGVGASAGGLEAFTELLEALGDDPGVAIVFVQHLAPLHESALPTLLGGRTRLPVEQVAQGTRIEANIVYVIPPNVRMDMGDGALHLSPRPEDHTQYTPIDFFFRSLAETAQSAAIGVILSGSSSDGALGLREIKAVGGITMAQDPKTARYDGMPRAAIASDAVDLVLSPADIAKEIRRIGRHIYVAPRVSRWRQEEFKLAPDELRRLVALLRHGSGIDFTDYKPPTIQRRVQRRMAVCKITDVAGYLRYVQSTPTEAQILAQDILIHVTRFFRDPEAFSALTHDVFPEIMARRMGDAPIRMWVAGCSTGEEAYSLAIILLEFLGDRPAVSVQIFATDASESAIEHARSGIYPQTIAADVNPERLRRFFSKSDGNYRISKAVRDLCVLARQDLTRDPPFSRLDLIVCRNVLIYLGSGLQRKLLNVFHYALKPGGFLMLGQAETPAPDTDFFSVLNKKQSIFRSRQKVRSDSVTFPTHFVDTPAAGAERRITAANRQTSSIQHEAQRILLERYAPPGVIVDTDLRIVQFLGHTGRFLEPAPGDANLVLPKMIREGLLYGLRTAFHEARREGRPARRTGLRVRVNGGDAQVTLEVVPLGAGAALGNHCAVLFLETQPAQLLPVKRGARGRGAGRVAADPRVTKLEQELTASRDYLQSIIQELEAANEELQSANEEILSSNEELQSTNEELDTAKEELQSTNEELNTVNEELHGRNEELSRVNSDLMNLLTSVQVALVIVDNQLKIHRFTPMAERVLNLIPSDVGRPISHIQPNIDFPDLEKQIHEVIETIRPHDREVRDREGRWFSVQIRPYKNVDNRIDGAVLALYDIDLTKRHESEMRSARDYVEAVFQTMRDGLVVLDNDLRIERVNKAFCDGFRLTPEEVSGRFLYEIDHGRWDMPQLRSALSEVLLEKRVIERLDIEHQFPSLGRRALRVNARRIQNVDGAPGLILLAIEDVTGHQK